MSPISESNVSISSMATLDMDMIILVVAMASALLVGLVLGVSAYCCLVTRRRKVRNDTSMSSPKNISNSYINYGSPGGSEMPVRKTIAKKDESERKLSVYSVYNQNSNASFSDIMDKFRNSLCEESAPYLELEEKKSLDEKAILDEDLSTGEKKPNISVALNTCQNLSSELSELGLTGSGSLPPPSLQITASTSLCEQCLSPPPSPLALLGTSVSLPPTSVEITKAALGMTNPAPDHPVVCDQCLSPSKFGETSRSLKLPLIGIGPDLHGHRKMSPSGIVTNPRMKNPLLTTLREAMSNDTLDDLTSLDSEDKSEISERKGMEDNSFDSLLSPSKACEWLSADPFELSSDADKSGDDPRMIKIQPKIKVKKSRNKSEGSPGDSLESSQDHKSGRSTPNKVSLSDDPRNCILSPPTRNQAAVPNLANFTPKSASVSKGFQTPTHLEQMTPPLYSPFLINQFFPILPPPSPFQTPPVQSDKHSLSLDISRYLEVTKCSNTESCSPSKPHLVFQFPPAANTSYHASHDDSLETPTLTAKTLHLLPTYVVDSPTATQTPIKESEPSNEDPEPRSPPHESPQTASPSHLAWDSTFEALKTLECSMKLVVTPLHKKIDESYEDSPADSNDSQLSAGLGNKSCVSSVSLAWDNTGEMLAGGEQTSPQSLNSSMQSLDIDEIICRVAPNLLQSDIDPQLTPMPKYNTSILTPSVSRLSVFETSSPLIPKLYPGSDMKALLESPTSLSVLETVTKSNMPNTSASVLCASQLFPFNSPCPNNIPTEVSVCLPSGNQFLFKPDSPGDRSSCLPPSDSYIFTTSPGFHLEPPSRATSCNSSLLTVHSLQGSPNSCVSHSTEDFLSACGSLDSYSTVFEL